MLTVRETFARLDNLKQFGQNVEPWPIIFEFAEGGLMVGLNCYVFLFAFC